MKHRNAPVRLHNVEDVEGFCKAVVQRALTSSGSILTEEEREDAVGHLIVEAIAMSGIRDGVYAYTPGEDVPKGVFDPSVGLHFRGYLGKWLPGRLVDWYRREKVDSRNKIRPEFFPLDDAALDREVDPTDFVEQIVEAASMAEDLAALSDNARRIVDAIVRPYTEGESYDEIAERLGISRRRIARLLEGVRNEILGIALGLTDDDVFDVIPPTTDEIVEALHALDKSPIDHNRREQ